DARWRPAGRLDALKRTALSPRAIVLAAMNTLFYLAIARLPLATVGAIEFLCTVVLDALAARSGRTIATRVSTVAGFPGLSAVQIAARPLGIALAFGTCAAFMLYVVLGH